MKKELEALEAKFCQKLIKEFGFPENTKVRLFENQVSLYGLDKNQKRIFGSDVDLWLQREGRTIGINENKISAGSCGSYYKDNQRELFKVQVQSLILNNWDELFKEFRTACNSLDELYKTL